MSDKIVKPDGSEYNADGTEGETHRSFERRREDDSFIPVIIKRTDESIIHPDDILNRVVKEGLEQHKRSKSSLCLSAFSAGLILGFAAMAVAVASQIVNGQENFYLQRLIMAIVYPLGFIVCIMSRTQLFTEHTATAVYPVLDNKIGLRSLLTIWVIVLFGNFLGTFSSAFLISLSDSISQVKPGILEISHHLLAFSPQEVFSSSILAGWLMAQGGWLVNSTSNTVSQVMFIYIVTFLIGFGGLHHSIAGSAEIFGGLMLSPEPDYYLAARFLSSSVLGNLVGGSVFVAILNYAHIKSTQDKIENGD